MKAIVQHVYGSPDVLRLEEIEPPAPASDEVLIRVVAASVNPYDWHLLRGSPYLLRLLIGLRKPREMRLGADLAGEVVAVGDSVIDFRPGDAVFGTCRGAFAEFVCGPASLLAEKLTFKPGNVSFEQAAGAGIAGTTALKGLRDKAGLRAGQLVLINGASGGVGTFAVQIAKSFGAFVTGVCSTRNVDMVRGLGADEVVDYIQEDVTQSGLQFDVILDCVGNHSMSEWKRIMKPSGIHVAAGGSSGRWGISALAQTVIKAIFSGTSGRRFAGMLTQIRKRDLDDLAELLASGKVRVVVDRSYPLSETAEALRYVERGHAKGKVVVTLRRDFELGGQVDAAPAHGS